jgi:hypothetical protein
MSFQSKRHVCLDPLDTVLYDRSSPQETQKESEMRILLTSVLFAFLAQSAAAELKWSACRNPVSAFERNGDPGLGFQNNCEEMLIDDVRLEANQDLTAKLNEWRSVWVALQFPPRVFKYEMIFLASDTATSILLSDADDIGEEMLFPHTPYTTIVRSLIFNVPACHKMTITFLSPWPPKLRRVNVHWTKSSPSNEWEVETDRPINIAVPAWARNPFAAQSNFYTEGMKTEPMTAGDSILLCSPK